VLLGTAIVPALMRNRRDDCGLIVVPPMRGDTGLLADQGARAVGADQKARRDGFAVGKLHVGRICVGGKTRNWRGSQFNAERFCFFRKSVN